MSTSIYKCLFLFFSKVLPQCWNPCQCAKMFHSHIRLTIYWWNFLTVLYYLCFLILIGHEFDWSFQNIINPKNLDIFFPQKFLIERMHFYWIGILALILSLFSNKVLALKSLFINLHYKICHILIKIINWINVKKLQNIHTQIAHLTSSHLGISTEAFTIYN